MRSDWIARWKAAAPPLTAAVLLATAVVLLAGGAAGQSSAPAGPEDSAGPPVRTGVAVPAPAASVPAEGVPAPIRAARSSELKLESCLQDAAHMARVAPLDEVRRALGEPFVKIADDGRVHVELVAPAGWPPVPRAWVAAFGGTTDTRWGDRLDAWIPLASLIELASALPAGYRVERASAGSPDQVAGEGPAAIGSDTYRNGGANGAGVVIAVIDGGYWGLSAARANGDAPALANTTTLNYTPFAFEGDGAHGTGCVEAAFDHAPGATWRLYKIDSLADMGTAVADALANSADVITHSLSRYNQGWADNSGAACAVALQAANAGAVFFTSAGNRAQQHLQTVLLDTDGDGWHEFTGIDETIDMVMPANTGGDFHLSWNTGAGSADYNLLLWDVTRTIVLASSTNSGNTFESLSWANTTASAAIVHLTVKRISGASVEFELFEHGGGTWNEYVQAQGSTTSPSNATHANVISVGAVDWGDFTSPAGTTGILESYSSRGPSNSGMTLPDLCGPTNTTGFTYPAGIGGFSGTSCATPNAAGAAAALWSSLLPYAGSAVRWLALEQARLKRDWGTGGADDLYGRGGAVLAPFAANRTWLARGYGNSANLSTGPRYTLAAASAATAPGGRILVLPGSYPEAPVTVTAAALIEGWGGSVLLGP